MTKGLAASGGACTTKSPTPSLFENEKDFPLPLTVWMGIFRVLGLGRLSFLLDTQTSEVTALWKHYLTDPSALPITWFASYLSSCVWRDDICDLEKRCWEIFVCLCTFIHNTTQTKASPCVSQKKAPETIKLDMISGTTTLNLEDALSNL